MLSRTTFALGRRTCLKRSFGVTSAQTYSERMDKTGRPVSPHVDIYKFPPAALSSITHRVTGCVLAAGKFNFILILSIRTLPSIDLM